MFLWLICCSCPDRTRPLGLLPPVSCNFTLITRMDTMDYTRTCLAEDHQTWTSCSVKNSDLVEIKGLWSSDKQKCIKWILRKKNNIKCIHTKMWRLCAIYVVIMGLTLLTMDSSVYGVIETRHLLSIFAFFHLHFNSTMTFHVRWAFICRSFSAIEEDAIMGSLTAADREPIFWL